MSTASIKTDPTKPLYERKEVHRKAREEQFSALWKRHGAFFAFSKEQFNEQRVEGVTYVRGFAGIICPKDNYKAMMDEMNGISDVTTKAEIEDLGMDAIIEYELWNHECFYTMSPDGAMNVLKDYGFSENDIWRVFHHIVRTQSDKY